MPIEESKNKFVTRKITRYLYLWYLGTIPSSSKRFIAESTHLDIIRIMNSYLRDFASIANENALMNPAIGALILSSLQPNLLSVHRIALYATLDKVANPPNLAQS